MIRQRVSLGELCELVKGTSPISRTLPGRFPLVTTGEEYRTADSFQFDREAVCIPLISSTGHGHASLKRVHYQNGKFALGNLLAAALVKDTARLSARFLAQYLTYTKDRLIVPLMTGAANMSISVDRLATVPIEFPPSAQQERIVKLIDEADGLRQQRTEADRRTEELIPSLFHEMFGDPEHTSLPVERLMQLVTETRPITYGILKPGPNVEGGVPYVRVLDIKQSRLHVSQLHKTTKEIAAQYGRSTLRPGDILVTIRGTVGRTCIVPDELIGANITQDTARVATIPSIEPVYVVEFLNTPWAQSWMNHHMKGQTVKGINLGDLKELPVPVPGLKLQKEFALRVSEIRAMQFEQVASRRHLDSLFESLRHNAFNGDL